MSCFSCFARSNYKTMLTSWCKTCGTRRVFSDSVFKCKIDLVQAESIADLIHATSETSARMALRSLSGEFSTLIHRLEATLVRLRVFVEAGIDFSDEEIDILS